MSEPQEPMHWTPDVQLTDIPPGAVGVRRIPFDDLYDSEFLCLDSETTLFFADSSRFRDGRAKYTQECSLRGAGKYLPLGFMKEVGAVSIDVDQADGNKLFEVKIFCNGDKVEPFRTCELKTGLWNAKKIDCFRIYGGEAFAVTITDPEKKGGYARVRLHGTLYCPCG